MYCFELVITIAWFVWYQRNSVVHGALAWFAGGLISKTEALLEEYKAVNVLCLWELI